MFPKLSFLVLVAAFMWSAAVVNVGGVRTLQTVTPPEKLAQSTAGYDDGVKPHMSENLNLGPLNLNVVQCNQWRIVLLRSHQVHSFCEENTCMKGVAYSTMC